MSSSHRDAPTLERSLGLFACTVMGVGVILGAGIYALVGKAAALAGDAVWMAFLAAAGLAVLTGLSYAELAALIPRAGGEYHYVRRAFGARAAFLVTWLLLCGIAVLSAAVALGFAGYLRALVPVPSIAATLGLLVACAALLVQGIRASARFAVSCTALEVVGLVAVVVLGAPHLGRVDLLHMPHGLGGVASAAALVFFAYIGFEEIVQLAEEAREPTRTLSRAILLSIGLSTVLYVLVALAAVSVLGWERLGASESPLADVAGERGGRGVSVVMAGIALFSTANTVLVLLLSGSRLLWGMAEDGALPARLARVHAERRTPWVATLVVAGAAAVVAASLRRIEAVANLTLFVTFAVVNAAVIALRLREPDAPRPFRIPGRLGPVPVVPAVGLLSAVAMMTRTGGRAALTVGWLALAGLALRALVGRGTERGGGGTSSLVDPTRR